MVHRICGVRNTVLALVVCALFQVPAYAIMYEMKYPQKEIAAAWGMRLELAKAEYTANDNVRLALIESNIPGNILWQGDTARFTVQIQNKTAAAISGNAQVRVIQYGALTPGEDVFEISFFKIAEGPVTTVPVNVPAKGYQNVIVAPAVPNVNGGYALVIELPGQERLLITPFVRTFHNDRPINPFTFMTIDNAPGALASRINAAPNRIGMAFRQTKDFTSYLNSKRAILEEYKKYGVCVSVEYGHETETTGPLQPLGRARTFLDSTNKMIPQCYDICPLPEYDSVIAPQVLALLREYGYPRGPVIAVKLWNEPWEGGSIAGWGADMIRYREMFMAMTRGVAQARKEGLQVLIGGCDSHSNTLDKMFGDGNDSLLKWLDFCSIHYENTAVPTLIKSWNNRPASLGGRVKIWDTESWVGNSDDRIGAVIGFNKAMGLDRAVGIHHAAMFSRVDTRYKTDKVASGEATVTNIRPFPVTAAVAANTYLIGDRKFKELLFKNGLPWVLIFDGLPGKNKVANPDDGTVMVIGDIGPVFGVDYALFRNVRGQKEIDSEDVLRKELSALKVDDPRRAALIAAINKYEPIHGRMLLNGAKKFNLFDFYGNPVAPNKDGTIEVPLDSRGFFLRADGSKGSFAALTSALKNARIEGLEPLSIAAHDFTAPIESKPVMNIELTNILNIPVSGSLTVSVGTLVVSVPATLALKANETKTVAVKVLSGAADPSNLYRLRLVFDALSAGRSIHEEDMRVNMIAKKSIVVDGNLDDWKGALPQFATAPDKIAPSLTEEAWFPFKSFDKKVGTGMATGYMAYDKDNFYFAAKIADPTPDNGMMRMAGRNDDVFFYPETSYSVRSDAPGNGFGIRWSGTVLPRFSEEYTLSTISDDGVRLYLNDSLVIDNWTDHGEVENSAMLKLVKGKPVAVKIEYYQGGGNGVIGLFWHSKSQVREKVPANCLAHVGVKKGSERGLKGDYFSDRQLKRLVVSRIDTVLSFQWTDKQVPDSAYRKQAVVQTIDTLVWPKGVRRYSYRTWPELPSGSGHDNVQVAFNVVPAGADEWEEYPRGTMPKFTQYKDTDYEYALNPIAKKYGGGAEIWRLKVPGMVHKHFFPRQPKCPQEGAVTAGKLVCVRDSSTRVVECALPWAEIPKVKEAIDKGKTVKFTFRVNDNSGSWIELTTNRSVSKLNCTTFHCDWEKHWSNEVEFAAQK